MTRIPLLFEFIQIRNQKIKDWGMGIDQRLFFMSCVVAKVIFWFNCCWLCFYMVVDFVRDLIEFFLFIVIVVNNEKKKKKNLRNSF